MKGIICTSYGPPEVLQVKEVPKPSFKNNEILVKIMATSVNSADARVRGLAVNGFLKILMRLVLGFSKPRKSILGTIYSGIVEQVGKDVSEFKVGDEVFGMTGYQFGTYAEYISVAANSNVILKPQNASFEEAAALPFGGQTAIYFLEKAKIAEKKNPKVLIYGATGSVGVAAIQIAQHYDSDITAVCSSRGLEVVKNLGIKDVILYDQEDFTTTSKKYDIILDAVGKTSKQQCKKLLEKGGIYKTVGGLDAADENRRQLKILKALFEKGSYKAVIDKIYSMTQIVEAHRYVDSERKKGNVILIPN